MADIDAMWFEADRLDAGQLVAAGLSIDEVPDLRQYLASGDLTAWSADRGVPIADWANVEPGAAAYAVQVARDRVLAVVPDGSVIEVGWCDGRYAVTEVSGGLQVFEMSGPGLPGLLARATTLADLRGGRSAAISFAGVRATAYGYGQDCIRLHVDRGLATYVRSWIATSIRKMTGR